MSGSLLAVDTSTERCGAALLKSGRVQAELSLDIGGTHTSHILSAIESLLGFGRMALADVDAFAVTKGPGSFTGLRIGVSTVKGLAFGLGKPLIGISSLRVLASQAGGDSGLICAMIDARRNEVYWRIFQNIEGTLHPLTQEQAGPLEILAGQITETCTVIGNAVPLYADRLQELVTTPILRTEPMDNGLRPAVLAQLAWDRYQQGLFEDVDSFVPVYIRKSDAENRHGEQPAGPAFC